MTQTSTARRHTPPDVKGLRVPERTLELLRDLVQEHTGMFYDESRLDFLRDRLAPLVVERGFDSFLDRVHVAFKQNAVDQSSLITETFGPEP